MKKIILPILIGGWIVAYLLGQTFAEARDVQAPLAAVNLVAQTFTATGAKLTDYEVHDWTTLCNQALPKSELQQIGGKLAKELGVRSAPIFTRKGTTAWSIEYSDVGGLQQQSDKPAATVALMSMNPAGGTPQTVLAIRVTGSTRTTAIINKEYQQVEHVVQALGGQPQINVTMIGSLPRSLDTAARAGVIAKAYAKVAGKQLQIMQDPFTSSVAGYAPANAPVLAAGRQKLNLQVAMYKSNRQKDTKVLVGNPVITIEY